MRKDVALPALALAGGAAGFLVRLWQRAAAWDPSTHLFQSGAPATAALLALTAAVALAALLLSRGAALPEEEPARGFFCPSSAYMTLAAAGAMALLAAAALGVPELVEDLQLWRANSRTHPMPLALGLTLAGCAAGGIGGLVTGRNNYRGLWQPAQHWMTTLPAYAALMWLMELYQVYSREPVLLSAAYPLMAVVFLLLALYYQSAVFFGRPRPRRFFFCAVMGVFLGLTSLADGGSLFELALTAALVLCVLGAMAALGGNAFPHSGGRRVLRPDAGPRQP